MIFGLTITEEITASTGPISGAMIRVREVCYCGLNSDGAQKINVGFEFYESRAKYLAKEPALNVAGENKRVNIIHPFGVELTETLIYLYLKTPLANIYTMANEQP